MYSQKQTIKNFITYDKAWLWTLFFIFYFPFYTITAQDFQWIKDGGSAESIDSYYLSGEEVLDLVTDSQRNVYVIAPVGLSDLNIDGHPKTNWSGYPNPVDYVLASFTCNGTYRWSKMLGGGYGGDYLKSVVVDSNDNVYVAGDFSTGYSHNYPSRIEDDFIETGTQNNRRFLYIAKFDTNGVFQWIVEPEEPITPNNLSLEMFMVNDTLQWFVYIDSGTYANGSFVNTNGYEIYKLSYDLNGNFLDAKAFSGVELINSFFINIYRNQNNNSFYLMCHLGDSSSEATVNGVDITGGVFIANWNSTGTFQWFTQSNTDVGRLFFQDMDFDLDNNIYFLGTATGMGDVNFLDFTIPETIIPNFVFKLNPTATNIIWSTYANKSGSRSGGLMYNENKVMVTTGAFGEDFTWGNMSLSMTPNGSGERGILLASFDSQTGSTLSLNKIEGDGYSSGNSITVDNNGDYIIGGGFGHYIYDVNGNQNFNAGGNTDFFVSKFATEACGVANVKDIDLLNISLYPNPSKNNINIKSSYPISNITIYTILGQKVITKNINLEEETLIKTTNLSKGIYYIKIQTETQTSTLSFIKE